MNLERILAKYESHTLEWIEIVKQLSEKAYAFKPAADAWSVSEIMDHVNQVTHKCLDHAQRCIDQKGETNHSGFGPAVFSLMGAFPPVKLRIKKIPEGMEHIYKPQAISKEQALDELGISLKRMREMKSAVSNAGKKQRIEHWAGGWFNASQWYHSAEMHLKHHFRQLKRLQKKMQQ